MRDVLVTSSVLILALLVLRQIFRKAISRRMQYALWGLVLLRLLAPVSLPAMEHNVLTAAEPVRTSVAEQIDNVSVYLEPVGQSERAQSYVEPPDTFTPAVAVRDSRSDTVYEHDYQELNAVARIMSENGEMTWYAKALPLTDILTFIWYAGIAIMACWLVFSNLRFWHKLRKGRIPYAVEGCRYPVYLCDGLPSPCLFGLFRPAIYLTPAAVSSPESLRHVLAHETTHARHLDPLWSLLRGVCLAVYWFDPLVWTAAAVSRTDCELACDEGALKRLGQEERVAYGRTLLALIPVVKAPADPMLAATTMTSGKRRLKDRITRIAENRQTVSAALFAVAAAAALLCAVTFTGAKVPGGGTRVRPLTGAELKYFNEEFFNGDGFNIRNQFLTCLYESPEEINLFSLFYNGTGTYENPDDERRAVAETGYGGYYPDTDLTKITAADMDAVLMQYTGLTLAQTSQVDLDAFTYLPAYDAYYFFHGDTNARGATTFFTGEREGDTIRLYYTDFYFGGYGPCCVTLEARPDGSYWFVSHLFSDMPAISPALPDWDPEMTISLEDLAPYEAPGVTVERHTGDVERLLYSSGAYEDTIDIYRSTDGNTYAALEVTLPSGETAMDCFLTFPEDETFSGGMITDFYDLLGRNGVAVSYNGWINDRYYGTFHDYYYVTDEGVPSLLARAYGNVCVSDLDGDGKFEIAASAGGPAQLFFQREGILYCADIEELVENAWPDAQHLSFGQWDAYSRSLPLSGEVPIPGAETHGTAFRDMYFNGENLLLYKDRRTAADHVLEGIEAPEDVLVSAKIYVRKLYNERETSALAITAEYDDWYIKSLTGPYYETVGSLQFEIWRLNYEFHTTTPDQVILAGGRYITEDSWVSPGYPDCDYLFFQLVEDGSRTYLYSAMENDCSPGTELFFQDMVYTLLDLDLLSLPDLDGQSLLDMLSCQPAAFLNSLAQDQPDTVQAAVIETLGAYVACNGSYDVTEAYESCVHYMNVFDSDLTTAGRALWTALQAAVAAPVPTDAEAALSRFTANPASLLNSAAQLPEASRQELCQGLAFYYDAGSSAQQARFRDAMHSVTQEQLSSGATEVYDLLRASCALPGPAERTSEDINAIFDTVDTYLDNRRRSSTVVSFDVLELSLDDAETTHVVKRYTASLLANGRGWTDDYTSHMVAVKAVWNAEYTADAFTSGHDLHNGVNACYFYMLPDPISGTWEIWDSMGCDVPARYSTDPAGLPFVETAQPTVSFTQYDSYEAAYNSLAWENDAFELVQELKSETCTVISWAYRGTPHGTAANLCVLYPDGTMAHLPLPPRNEAGVSDPPENLTLSADGATLSYTAAFDDNLVNMDGTALWHKAGTYQYTYNMDSRAVSLTIKDN